MLTPWKKKCDKPRQHNKKKNHHLANTGEYSQSYCFSSSHVWIWELDYKEGWVPKKKKKMLLNYGAGEDSLESPGQQRDQPVSPKGNKLWIFVGREKVMAPHSSALAWKIPRMEEPGRLQSMGSRRVEHDWATSLSLFIFMHWRRKWQPTPVFLPGESQGRGNLVGCRLWDRTESDMTETTYQQQHSLEGPMLKLKLW